MPRYSAQLALRHSALGRALNVQMTKFLNADLALGLTFAAAAMAAGNQSSRKERNRTNAQKALDAVVKHRHQANLNSDDSAQIETKINRLRIAIQKLDQAE